MKLFHNDIYEEYINEKIEIIENDVSTMEEKIYINCQAIKISRH